MINLFNSRGFSFYTTFNTFSSVFLSVGRHRKEIKSDRNGDRGMERNFRLHNLNEVNSTCVSL